MSVDESTDRNVEIWKIKKLIKSLEAARGYVRDHSRLIGYLYSRFVSG